MSSDPARGHRQIEAGEFEAICLKLVDQVAETGEEIIVTKLNRPVAKLVPFRKEELRPFVEPSRNVISGSREDLMTPIGENWEVDADI